MKFFGVIIYAQRNHDKLKPITMYHANFSALPPCDYLAAVRQAVCNPCEFTPNICIRSLTLQHSRRYCLRTWTTETITASDMVQQWQPPTCLVPSHSSRRLVAQELPCVAAASIDLCVLCEHDSRVRTRRFGVEATPSPDGLVLSDPASSGLGYGAVALRSTACGSSYSLCRMYYPKFPQHQCALCSG